VVEGDMHYEGRYIVNIRKIPLYAVEKDVS
jgi:hypothetical protein